ncbi:UDP-N-acetylmuramate dehydrogenase [Stenotrophomonas koreensis]|uniref:UDP-N-acetylmuramate dehydrogenase n=1 Tax=Stenotrophomonas koreensis TaxID=266128 RepID=UPI003CCCBBD0
MSTPGWQLHHDVALQSMNTFGVAATAPRLLRVHDSQALPAALAHPEVAGQPLITLGGGSNLLLVSDPQATLLVIDDTSVTITEHRADHAIVRAGAGMGWHPLVMWTLDHGLSGLENLALIPGTAGAAPIQNIGAYGAQAGDFIHAVEAWDRHSGQFQRLLPEDCAFGYRDSVFKQQPDRWIITAIELRLPLLSELRTGYAGIEEQMRADGVTLPSARDVAYAVIAIRQRKLPDPARLGNAGSFFKNPIVSAEQAQALLQQWPQMPVFPAGQPEKRKLSAGWLIEQAGWKGYREGDAGVSPDHALVLVNHGQATGAQLLALAREIAASVQQRFGVAIEPEPRLIGAQW